jgi:hypothetical protein
MSRDGSSGGEGAGGCSITPSVPPHPMSPYVAFLLLIPVSELWADGVETG